MDISLTSGMRSNLINMQNTAKLMDQTSVRLNTGKKVNSALDDPISFFTAKSHMSRASNLETLKNGMSESIQTITAANNGISSIINLLEVAKSKAESAKSAETGSDYVTAEIKLSDIEAGDQITIGGDTYTAIAGATSGTDFHVGDTDSSTAAELMTAINANTEADNEVDATGINGSTISLEIAGQDMVTGDISIATDYESNFSKSLVAASDELSQLQDQFNELLSQIDQLQSDSGYKGINLLKSADSLSVLFEGDNKLTVSGFDADTNSMGVVDATWTTGGNIETDISNIEDAMKMLEGKASSLSSSLSIVTTRQDFTNSMINTLNTGADNLTLADLNEESANMLLLQTQQTLGINSLSLASQSAQAVLRLF